MRILSMRSVMALIAVLLFVSLTFCTTPAEASTATVSKNVNNFIGTGGYGFGCGSQIPGAQIPFGFARVSPESRGKFDFDWDHFGGYHYHDDEIKTFTHTHSIGAGSDFLGQLGLMPFTTETKLSKKKPSVTATFAHSNETAVPGKYSVNLEDAQIYVDTTATSHVGVHRYTYASTTAERCILIDSSISTGNKKTAFANISIDVDAVTITGMIQSTVCEEFHIYYTLDFPYLDHNQITQYGTYTNKTKLHPGDVYATGSSVNPVGGYICFASNGAQQQQQQPLEVRVGLSIVSAAYSAYNVHSLVNQTFSNIVTDAKNLWEKELGRIVLDNSTSAHDASVFYSAVYHSLLAPTKYSEPSDNATVNCAGEVVKPTHATYSDLSIWDIHRTEFPWLTIFKPGVAADVLKSVLGMAEVCGILPKWPLAMCFTGSMIGQHSAILLADGVVKGLLDAKEAAFALEALVYNAGPDVPQNGRADVKFYNANGFVRFEESSKAAAETLEYAYDDYAISTIAQTVGNTSMYTRFLQQSHNWQHVFDNETLFMCPKYGNNTFHCPKYWVDIFGDIIMGNNQGYCEGDAWQFRFFVPHDMETLATFMGGKDNYVKELDFMFTKTLGYNLTVLPNAFYWAGNEPDLLAVWQFAPVGRPDLTQYWQRKMTDQYYTTNPDGIPGNDDYGTMSSWAVFSYLGIYPVSGTINYILGSPACPGMTIDLPNGALTMTTHDWSTEAVYVSKILLNGAVVDAAEYVEHSQIFLQPGGATLEFYMTETSPTITSTITTTI